MYCKSEEFHYVTTYIESLIFEPVFNSINGKGFLKPERN
jgi:hypothetical protein